MTKMKRKFENRDNKDVVYYVGVNVEKTLAYGQTTLFLQEMRPAKLVIDIARDRECTHIYIGANGTFKPKDNSEWSEYDALVDSLTDAGFLVTMEHNLTQSAWFLESCFADNNMVIPVITVEIPYISQYGNNSCIKITDKSFGETNPGVWVHSYNDITKTDAFTHWSQYNEDKPI